MGYPPGVRENGGQYTHAALWVAMAFARLGDGERAVEVLQMLNPIEHARTPEDYAAYRTEPYVVAADVYSLEESDGTRRLDVVYRLGGMDVPGVAGGGPGVSSCEAVACPSSP